MSIIDTLRTDGICVLPDIIPRQHVDEFVAFLRDKPEYIGQVESGSRPATPDDPITCWRQDDVMQAPHFRELAIRYEPLIEEYLGGAPVLYSINAFTTRPAQSDNNIQEFHRDHDAPKFVGLFMLCTDVLTMEDGGHEYIRKSHEDRSMPAGASSWLLGVCGPAGTLFFADTRGFHSGRIPSKPRTMAWARWRC
jgi:hypothetical protein